MLPGPKSGEQLDQIAPRLAAARKAIRASGPLGTYATTRSPSETPRDLRPSRTTVFSTGRSLRGRPLVARLRAEAAAGLPVDEAGEGNGEAGGIAEGGEVDAVGHVLVRVVPGGEVAFGVSGAQGDGAHAVDP